MQDTYRVIITMRVKAGCESAFDQALDAMVERISGDPGIVAQNLFTDLDDPAVRHVVSEWADAGAFRTHERSPAHRASIGRLAELRDGVRMSTMTVVHAVAPSP